MMMMMTIRESFTISSSFCSLLTAPQTNFNTYALMARAPTYANHVQHVGRLSREICHVPVVGRDSSAIKFDGVAIAFILTLLHWLKALTGEEGEKTGIPRENFRRRASERAVG